MNKQSLYKAGAAVLALGVWQLVSSLVGIDMLLASPLQVILRLGTIWREPGFFSTVLFSMLRIMAGFLAAFLLGTLLAVLSGRFRIV
ncbi:MAG: nitrate ABC transporter permease, partial [Lachnospiraceae bacterium]|nr:nitrate ABC transporter permease [Lachnospiraceae bacterium]